MDFLYHGDIREFTIQKGCPWYEAQQNFGPPTVHLCEPLSCSYINNPLNAWTNLGYLLVGLWIFLRWKKTIVRFFGAIVFSMGFFSFTYHATNNHMSQFYDFFGMFLMTGFLLAFNLERFFKKPHSRFWIWFWAAAALNLLLFITFDYLKIAPQYIIFIDAAPVVVLDLVAGAKEHRLGRYGLFVAAVLVLALAQVFAILDAQHIYCHPEGFIHGHAIWHLLGATGMLLAALHMRRMDRPPIG